MHQILTLEVHGPHLEACLLLQILNNLLLILKIGKNQQIGLERITIV